MELITLNALFAALPPERPKAEPPRLPALVKDKMMVIVKYVILQAVPKPEIHDASSKLGTRLSKISTTPNIAQNTAYELKQPSPVHASLDIFCRAVAAVMTREIATKNKTKN